MRLCKCCGRYMANGDASEGAPLPTMASVTETVCATCSRWYWDRFPKPSMEDMARLMAIGQRMGFSKPHP